MAGYTFKQIARSFEQKKEWEKQFSVNYYFVRPLSFLVTYLIIRLMDSPSKVAWAGFCIGLTGCIAFSGISIWTAWPPVILLAFFSLLDAVDGNIARTTGNVTYYGKFLDGSIGELIEGSYCFFLGLGLTLNGVATSLSAAGDAFPRYSAFAPILSGSVIMAGRLYSSFIDLKYGYHSYEKQRDENKTVSSSIYDEVQTSTYSNKWYYKVFININLLNNQLICLALFLWFGKAAIFLNFLALYYLARLVIYFTFFVRRAQQRLL
jgi:phosphatidylglycerophosphate synthase